MAASEVLNVLLRVSQTGVGVFKQASDALGKSLSVFGSSGGGAKQADISRMLGAIDEYHKTKPGAFSVMRAELMSLDRSWATFLPRFRAGMASMKGSWGGNSPLGQMSFLLRGGAAAGVFAGMRQIASQFDAIKETRVSMGSGEASSRDLADSIARAIPGVGTVYGLITSIRENFDGTVQESIDLEKAQRKANAELERSEALLARSRVAAEAVKNAVQQGIDDRLLSEKTNPVDRAKLQAQFKFDDAAKEFEKQLADKIISGGAFDRAMAGLRMSLAATLADIARQASEQAMEDFRQGNEAMEAKLKDELRTKRLASLGGREAVLDARLGNLDGTIAGIDERAGIGRAGFITRGSGADYRIQQEIQQKRAEANDRKNLIDLQRKATDDLKAIRTLIEIVRNGGAGTPFVLFDGL